MSIENQAQTPGVLSTTDDAANLFLSRWTQEADQETPDPASAPEETEEDTEAAEEVVEESEEEGSDPAEDSEDSDADHQEAPEETEDPEETEAEDDAEDEADKPSLADDAVVKVKVDGKELDVSVKDLKRLFGQEAALTRKSQEVAQKRQETEATAAKLNASMEKLLTKAADRFKPYAEIDWLVASKQLDADQLSALRKEAQAAYEDYRFISEEADAFVAQTKQAQQEALLKAAGECVKVLKADIPQWSDELYGSLREYAVGQGFDAEVFNNIVDPAAIKLIHKARLYDQTRTVKTVKKVVPTPKKVLKTTVAPAVKVGASVQKATAAKTRLERSGSIDDAADLFMSRWAASEE